MAFVKHRFGKTFFEKRGRKRATRAPLIFLHGGPGGHSRFLRDLFFLSDERQVFIYDQIGGGRSTPLSKKFWNIQTFVNELDALVKAWELEQFPAGWERFFSGYHEIWCPSSFTAQALAQRSPIPVIALPHLPDWPHLQARAAARATPTTSAARFLSPIRTSSCAKRVWRSASKGAM